MARHLFDPSATTPFPLSRSKVELFLECARCFYLDRKLGISRPDSAIYSLNLAVDHLLKKEFDTYRLEQQPHPLVTQAGVEAIPFKHPEFGTWRDSPTGIRSVHRPSNIELFGIVDDVWINAKQELHPVDYKATSTGGIPTLDGRESYGRQLEIYSWLLQQNGFVVAPNGYLLFANADKEKPTFDRTLSFKLTILTHRCDTSWIPDALQAIRECLEHTNVPSPTSNCEWCIYRKSEPVSI